MLETKLYTFLKLAECGSTTRCAEQLHITQPAVSQHLKALEAEYGLCLFAREGRRLVLTPEGKRFYHLARRLATMDRQLRELAVHAQPPALRFGATLSISEGVMPSLLPALAGRFPSLPIRLVTANTAALLLRERGSGSRDIFESECLAHNLHPGDFACLHEIDSIPVILQMAAQDRGVTFAYECAARPLLRAGLLQAIPLTDFGLVRPFCFVTLPNSLAAERSAELAAILEQLARGLSSAAPG